MISTMKQEGQHGAINQKESIGQTLSDNDSTRRDAYFYKTHELDMTVAIGAAVESGMTIAVRRGVHVGIEEKLSNEKAKDVAVGMIQSIAAYSIESIDSEICYCVDQRMSQDQAFDKAQCITMDSVIVNAVAIDQANEVDSKIINKMANVVVDAWLTIFVSGLKKSISIGMEIQRTFLDALNDAKNQALSMVKVCIEEKYLERDDYINRSIYINDELYDESGYVVNNK